MCKLGIPANAWYVCLHCREQGYHRGEDMSNCRDANIDNYLLAMTTIVQKGGWCIRMGDPSMKKLPAMPGIIDYAHHPLRSSWLDIFLTSTCRFFLGSASGLAQVANVFGVPCATANQVPLSVVYNHGIRDVSIPKIYRRAKTQQLISFAQILSEPMGNYRHTLMFDAHGLALVENSPDEINDLAMEMLECVQGPVEYSETDVILQNRLRQMFGPQHYTFYSKGRIGRAFLRKYESLIANPVPLRQSA